MAQPSRNQLNGMTALEKALGESESIFARGIEKEGLRALPNGDISQADFPPALGHPLTHPKITTDYSEALLELITPVSSQRAKLLDELEHIHQFVARNIGEEVFWAGSMPCRLHGDSSVRIAEYGDSNVGTLKYVYRKGLDVRYGRIMQSIAGLHFNFSLTDAFWQALQESEGSSLSLQNFKSDKYFALTRNFRRFSWLLMYLFGASPALDKSFLDGRDHKLEEFDEKGTLYRPFATSLRMSDLGYNNKAQSSLNICFNTLQNFTKTLGEAVRTPYPAYEQIGTKKDGEYLQLNTNILQIENEYYSSIRPKRTAMSGEKPTAALISRGVEYVEVRCLDLNPYLPLGIDATEIEFMDCFLLHCLLAESPILGDAACSEVTGNFNRVTVEGRKPELSLQRDGQTVLLSDWASDLCGQLASIASLLDTQEEGTPYSDAIQSQLDKINNVELCPSAKVLHDMKERSQSWLEFSLEQSKKHKDRLLTKRMNDDIESEFSSLAEQSKLKERAIKQADTQGFDEFLAAYIAR